MTSLDGMSQESFDAYKGGDQFNTVWKNIEILADEVKNRKSISQKIHIKMVVTQKNKSEKKLFYARINTLNLTPQFEYFNTSMAFVSDEKIDEFEDSENLDSNKHNGYSKLCRSVWNEMLIFWDGGVTVCCVDSKGLSIYGNATEEKLVDLFNKVRNFVNSGLNILKIWDNCLFVKTVLPHNKFQCP